MRKAFGQTTRDFCFCPIQLILSHHYPPLQQGWWCHILYWNDKVKNKKILQDITDLIIGERDQNKPWVDRKQEEKRQKLYGRQE